MDFPKDIILEILLRLPVKSVMTFKCVSSDWNDMISAAAFRKNYLSRHGGRKINGLSYKLVRVGGTLPPVMLPDDEANTRAVETYSSKTGKWSKSTVMAATGFYLGQLTAAKVIGGVFHWWDWDWKRLVAYNPVNPKGRVKLINLPWDRGIDGYGRKDFEGIQNGCLQFFIILGSIEVWVLKSKLEGGSYLDDDEDVVEVSRWTLAHRISFSEIGVGRSDFGLEVGHHYPLPIAISPWNPHIILLTTSNEIISYDQTERKIEVLYPYCFDEFSDEFVPFQWPVWPCL
ncbi:hypothetical protein RHMOL_Rhmol08G0074300 [Rhododendron molle]|uniref:Uncharacterized protein n=1 Tax=Rhododendron molle TaxID=49168 RepID=A0ACC0MKV2_RHOML|nr:hypothetical protein RHMOL_Rhmol08G0074300 [Rhododendron molle]